MPQADYTYDRDADCFVVTDDKGNEICRTASPHRQDDKWLMGRILQGIHEGRLIFPTPETPLPFTAECYSRYKLSRGDFERCPAGDKKFVTEKEAQHWIDNSRSGVDSDTDYRYKLIFPTPGDTTKP